MSSDNLAKQKQRKVEAIEGVMKVQIDEQGNTTKVGSQMAEQKKEDFMKFLKSNFTIMATTQQR